MPWYNSRELFNKAGLTFPYRPGNSRSAYRAASPRETESREEFNSPSPVKYYRPGSPENLTRLGYRPGANPKDLIFDNTNTTCVSDLNCATGFTCIGGRCQQDQGEAKAGTGSGADCEDPEPDLQDCPCDESTCGPRKCCNGPIYTRTVPRPGGGLITIQQCEPFEEPDNCNSFCTNHYQTFGTLASGCTMNQVCYAGRCVDGVCQPDEDKCNMGGKCGDCEVCDNDGNCVFTCDGCKINCTRSNFKCPCGNVYVSGGASIAYCQSGYGSPTCQQKLHRMLINKCEAIAPCSRPQGQNSCTTQQYGNTTLSCECVSSQTTCPQSGDYGGGYCSGFSQAGKRCYDRGIIWVPDPDARSQCLPGTKVTKFAKLCNIKEDEDGCNGPPGCPSGQKCNQQTGSCETDEEKEVCESGNVCQGNCCAQGGGCVAYRKFKIADNCHGQGGTFFGPAGGPTLIEVAFVPAAYSVCGRSHTHCMVMVNCQQVASHLECNNGLVDMGPAGFSGCPSPSSC